MVDLFSDAVSGSGVEIFGDNRVNYIFAQVTAIGTETRRLEVNDPDHILRFGWVAFIRQEDVSGETLNFTMPPIWIDFERFYWQPFPNFHGATGPDLYLWAHGIRWSLSLGASMHLRVGQW